MIELEKLASLDQVALAATRPAIDIRVLRGIDLRVHAQRGLDVGAAWFRGIPLAWIAPPGEGGVDAGEWRPSWGGGLVTTCGLDNVGAPSEGLGLHGTYTFLAARDVDVERSADAVVVRGTIDEPRGLRVDRTISTRIGEGLVELVDVTTNVGDETQSWQLLYHVNIGWPLWDEDARLETDADEVAPRDADAAADPDWTHGPRPAAGPERVYEHLGATRAELVNERVGVHVSIRSTMPRMWQWIDGNPSYYALGIEPTNCSVLGRAHDRAEGRLPMLAPGESRQTQLSITAAET